MFTFDDELTTTMNELKTKRFTNLWRQEQLNEKIWNLENSVIEQQVEEAEVRETLTRNRLELKDLKNRVRTLSSLADHEQHWLETVGKVSELVAIDDAFTHTLYRSTFMCSLSSVL